MRVVVIIPANSTTGGVELLYQFVDAANRSGAEAYICNYPFSYRGKVPVAYLDYDCPILKVSDIQESDKIILPEVYTYLWHSFRQNDVYLWWMSVDNYYGSRSLKYALGNRFFPWHFRSIKDPKFRSYFAGHLCQSQYAVEHLTERGITSIYWVSDYINRDFIKKRQLGRKAKRKNLIVFNPAKGVEQTRKIMEKSTQDFQPIQNLTRQQVTDLLLSAKVYIDFGNHPGKDRIPREAAALGCVVVTNRRGSAGNDNDVPIAGFLKIDDTIEGFDSIAAVRIDEIINNFEFHSKTLEPYREVIAEEEGEFLQSVSEFVYHISQDVL